VSAYLNLTQIYFSIDSWQEWWSTREKRGSAGRSWSYMAWTSPCTYCWCMFCHLCLGFWIYYVESCLLFISYATWILNDFDGLARLVNGCMRRWPTSFQRIKLHKSSMVRGESEFSRSFSSMTLWFARIFWFWTHCSNDLTNFENNIVA